MYRAIESGHWKDGLLARVTYQPNDQQAAKKELDRKEVEAVRKLVTCPAQRYRPGTTVDKVDTFHFGIDPQKIRLRACQRYQWHQQQQYDKIGPGVESLRRQPHRRPKAASLRTRQPARLPHKP